MKSSFGNLSAIASVKKKGKDSSGVASLITGVSIAPNFRKQNLDHIQTQSLHQGKTSSFQTGRDLSVLLGIPAMKPLFKSIRILCKLSNSPRKDYQPQNSQTEKHSISQSLLFATIKNAGISAGIIGAISLGFPSPTNAQLRLGKPLTNCNPGALPCPDPYPAIGTYQALQGNDNTYAVFIGGDFTIQGSSAEAEGSVFVYGDLNMDKTSGIYNMGWVGVGSFIAPDDQLDYVTVGGNVNVPNSGTRIEVGGIPSLSTPARGNLRHKGTVSGNVAVTAPGQIIADPNLDLAPFDAVFNELQTKSMCFANRATSSNATIDAQPWGVTISSTDGASGIYIINLDKNIDNGSGGATGITFSNFPDDATIIINMNQAGSADNITIRTYEMTGVSRRLGERILWNFPDAQNVAITGSSQFWGSVLIPNRNSTTLIAEPGMNGRFIAGGDVIHNGTGNEFHNYPFRGTLPTDCSPPPTTASISGTLYEDSDKGDDLDASEPKLPANITINLLDNSNNIIKTTTTDANGNYSFAGVAAGSYKIQVDTTDTDIPSGLTLGTTNNIPVTLTNANITGQNFGFDRATIPVGPPPATYCKSPYNEVYAVTQAAGTPDFYAIHGPTGAAAKFTSAPSSFGVTAINTAATDHVNKMVYYGDANKIYAWDAIADQHITVAGNFQSLLTAAGYTGKFVTLSSGGAAFYGGALYIGVDGNRNLGTAPPNNFDQDFEIFRVNLSADGKTAVSVTPLGIKAKSSGTFTTNTMDDWGDFIISDTGVILALSTNRGTSPTQRRFWKFDLNTNNYSFVSNTTENAQLAKSGDGTLWGLRSTAAVKFDNNGNMIGSPVATTVQAYDGAECVVGNASVGDRIWSDTNGDGVQDAGEAGIAGVTVAIYRDINKNGILDINEPKLATQVTDANGNYNFTSLLPHDRATGMGHNDFIVKVESGFPAGYTATTPIQKNADLASATEVLNNVDFGYKPPNNLPQTTDLTAASQPNPGGTTTVQVPTLAGTDPEDGALGSGKSFKIVTLPTNGTLYYNGTAVTAGQTISNYDPTKLTIDPNDGALTVSFTYAAIDSAGLVDATPATVTMPFTTPVVASPTCSTSAAVDIITNGNFDQQGSGGTQIWQNWVNTAPGNFYNGDPGIMSMVEDVRTLTITQPNLTGWHQGTGANGAAQIDIRMRWGDGNLAPSLYADFDVVVGGVTYASIRTVDGINSAALATITYSNGASGNQTQMRNGIQTDWSIYLPSNVPPVADLTFRHTPQPSATSTNSRDDFYVDSVRVLSCADYGDAPDSGAGASYQNYRTTASDNGPRHVPSIGLALGAATDIDNGTLQNLAADADDISTPSNDEDAFTGLPDVFLNRPYQLNNIPIVNTTGKPATLYAWIDFNQNGHFEAGESASTTINSGSTTANLSWATPSTAVLGNSYARFRLTTQPLADNTATPAEDERSIGAALSGEVEDYPVTIKGNPNLLLVKRITAINDLTTTRNGDDLSQYKDEPTNPYDDNTISITTPNPPTTPADTDKWPALTTFLKGGTDGGFTRPGDELEYTIYFLSTGDTEAKNVLFCDRVPSNVSFLPTAFNTGFTLQSTSLAGSDRGILVNRGGAVRAYSNTSDGDDAFYLAPGVDPTSLFPSLNCGGPNTNGAVVVKLGNLDTATAPATPPNSYGFVRFRGRVK
jgi:choice-of-anchor A domain-containing protein/uncharacterized repeat protein (TIGR01451 family)